MLFSVALANGGKVVIDAEQHDPNLAATRITTRPSKMPSVPLMGLPSRMVLNPMNSTATIPIQ